MSKNLLTLDHAPATVAVAGKCPRCGAHAVDGKLLCPCRDKTIEVSGQAFSTFSTLKDKQDYYQYVGRPIRMKEAPTLDKGLVDAMKRERLVRAYRFVWGGVVLVREEPNSPGFTIARGHRNACHDVNGVFMPKYIYQRARQARGYFYYNDLNQKVCTPREEFIPPDKLARVDYRYVDFGILKWHLEQRANAETLINSGVYDARENVPESEWTCVMVLKSKAGLYYEPGLEMIEVLQKREWENRNMSLKDIAAGMMQRTAKARLEKEETEDKADKKEWDQLYADVEKKVRLQKTYST